MEKIRVGVIGAGGNTRKFHIPNLQAQPEGEGVSVANRTPESGARVAEEFGIAEVAPSWQDIIEDESLDAICIGTWPYMHAPLTIAALDGADMADEESVFLDQAARFPRELRGR